MQMKLWIMGAALSLLAASPASALKVYRATSEGLADVKVYVGNSQGTADCAIHVEASEGLAKGNARWYYESSQGQADVNMYFTDSAGLADKTVYFTTSAGLAKCEVDWMSYKKQRASLPHLKQDGLAHSAVAENRASRGIQGRQNFWTDAVGAFPDRTGPTWLGKFDLSVGKSRRTTLRTSDALLIVKERALLRDTAVAIVGDGWRTRDVASS